MEGKKGNYLTYSIISIIKTQIDRCRCAKRVKYALTYLTLLFTPRCFQLVCKREHEYTFRKEKKIETSSRTDPHSTNLEMVSWHTIFTTPCTSNFRLRSMDNFFDLIIINIKWLRISVRLKVQMSDTVEPCYTEHLWTAENCSVYLILLIRKI